MRISDWSSDVCSSDLAVVDHDIGAHPARFGQPAPDGKIEQSGIKREIARQRAARIFGELVTLGNRDPRPPAGAVEQFEQIGAPDDADAAALEYAATPGDAAEAFMAFGRCLRSEERRVGK